MDLWKSKLYLWEITSYNECSNIQLSSKKIC